MKFIKPITFAGICILIFSSCSEILNEEPPSTLTQDAYYTNEKQAVAGVNGIYSIMTAYGQFYALAEIPTDEGQTGGTFQPSEPTLTSMDNFSFNASNRYFDGTWQTYYNGINRANLAISKIPDSPMDELLRNRLLGEAHFLRALYYFNLVRWFGDVPLLTSPTTNVDGLNESRVDKLQVYELIINDLNMASDNLPDSYSGVDIGRATKGAALTLLGKVYLTIENWEAAIEALTKVIDSNSYSLFPNYMDLWELENENRTEFIFSVQFKAGEIDNPYSVRFAPRSSGIQAAQSFGDVAPEGSYLDLYSSNDKRLQVFKSSYNKYNSDEVVQFGHPFCFKYFDFAIGGESGKNFPILRYADVLLMYAEAKNEVDGPGGGQEYSALWALNEVRTRAEISEITTTESKESLREIIWNERARELSFEGHRWFDLVRTDRLIDVVRNTGKDISDKHKLFPIPQREIDANNNLTQNSGY